MAQNYPARQILLLVPTTKLDRVLHPVKRFSARIRLLFVAMTLQILSAVAFGQAANNTCATAATLAVGADCSTTSGNLYLANQTNPTGSCGNVYDVWYRFTVPANSTFVTITVSLTSNPSTLTNTNTFIELFNTSICASLNGASVGGCNNVSSPRTYGGLTPGGTYYFRVYTTSNPSANSSRWGFNVCVTANDNCDMATTITPGTSFNDGTVFGASASPSIPVDCATGTPDDDVWYQFTAPYSYATITLTNIGTNLATSGTRTQLFSGACGTLTSLTCGKETINATGLTAGNTYYVRVYAAGTGQAGFTSSGSGFRISVIPSAPVAVSAGRMKEIYQQTVMSAPNVLADPWEITLGPDNNLWITESKGYRLYKMNPNTGVRDTILNISQGSTFLPAGDQVFNVQFNNGSGAQGGFAGLALHPKFLDAVAPQNFIYVSYVYSQTSTTVFTNRVVRFTYNTGTGKLESPVSLCDSLPGSNDHNSQRIIIAPVGGTNYLFYASGDMGAGQFGNVNRTIKAQFTNSYEGKILRFNLVPDADGGTLDRWIPNDNPYNAALGVQSAVWAIGIRNNQGFVYDTALNILYGSSHGPFSDDEINIIESGRNYGHPLVIGYAADDNVNGTTAGAAPNMSPPHPSSCPVITDESTNASNIGASYKDPLFSAYPSSTTFPSITTLWNVTTGANASWPSEGWSGLDLYTHTLVPGWNKSLVAASLKWGRLVRLRLNAAGIATAPTNTAQDTVSYFGSTNRFRDIAFAPNGKDVYVIMDRSSTTSGPSAANPIVPACAGCVQKYTFLGYADASGKSSIPASIDVTAGTPNSCATGTTVTIDNSNSNYWVPITGPDGNIMAEINANGQNLGNITSSFYTNTGAIRTRGSVRYLNRNITLTPQNQPGSAVKIRLYFSKAEYDLLDADALSGVNAIGDVKILKNADGCGNAIASSTELINPAFSEAHGANGYMLQGNISSFSTFYFASQNVALPLNLVTFTGTYKNGATLLNWETQNESNTDYFEVERSAGNGAYQSIGRVQARGSVDTKAIYDLTDAKAGSLGATVLYYRLRIVDKDGKTSYSQVVVINIADVVTSLSVYPNPAREEALLAINAATEQQLIWQLVDNTGRVLLSKQVTVRKGANTILIDVRSIPAGSYFIKVTGNTLQAIQKLQKL
jgi:trimeric autotransporter adhesin